MTDQELERVLREALRAEDPGERFSAGVMARLSGQRGGLSPASVRPRAWRRRRWLPAAVAACLLAGMGVAYRTGHERQRALAARSQLLQALHITSGYVDAARTVVIGEEQGAP